MDEIRVGVVGLGGRGQHWLRMLQKFAGYRVTAICDRQAALLEAAKAALTSPASVKTYARYEDLLADSGVDAVALCVRARNQGALAAQALEAGKHVSSEVPAAHTLEDCWRIVVAAERTGLVYLLGEQTRYWGFVDAWRDLVLQGRLGRVTFAEGQYIGFYGTWWYFSDPETGRFYTVEELKDHPEARPTWLHEMPPIHYLPHELSPMLKILDDRVVEVTAMSTRAPSYSFPEIGQPDIQVALMKTRKDAILRLATGYAQPVPKRGHHWYQVMGTRGCLEWKRSARDLPKMWLADAQMFDVAEVDWRFERLDAPAEARGSGHGDADYYVHASFRDAVLGRQRLEFDVYQAMDTAAPAILAAESIDQGTKLMKVPDFRPSALRPAGQWPASLA
ncbi:MAG: Gfo/Idh/MocA family oxidoreductase [Planctomycetes bacterium]|nr:Gfo/Idh/MocA family oxidoreductase [Planctomycetota bacterium]